MLDKVRFEGVVEAISTNWPKHKTSIKISGTYAEAPEIESQSIGEFHRISTPVSVEIAVSEQESVEFVAKVGSAKTDWVTDETVVSLMVTTMGHEFESKASILGIWAERGTKVSIRIEPAQKELL